MSNTRNATIRALAARGESKQSLADEYGVSHQRISQIVHPEGQRVRQRRQEQRRSALRRQSAAARPPRQHVSSFPVGHCIVCGTTLPPRYQVCSDCAVCRCGSGRPPSLCHNAHRYERLSRQKAEILAGQRSDMERKLVAASETIAFWKRKAHDTRDWNDVLRAKVALLAAENARRGSVCPCTLVEPCSDQCTCASPVLSGGCLRCASYGSVEQRTATAVRLAALDADCEQWRVAAYTSAIDQGELESSRLTMARLRSQVVALDRAAAEAQAWINCADERCGYGVDDGECVCGCDELWDTLALARLPDPRTPGDTDNAR